MTIEEINEEKTQVEIQIAKLVNEFSVNSGLKIKKIKIETIDTMTRQIYSLKMKVEF